MGEYFTTEGGNLRRTPEGLQALQDELEDLIRTFSPNKGNKMNEQTGHAGEPAMDMAFQPMDKAPEAGHVGDDGTVHYKIVEGDVYLDGVIQPKAAVKYVQEHESGELH